MADPLRKRFKSFIQTMSQYEDIDKLPWKKRKRKANYLLWSRKIIVEQKVLEMDQSHRPQEFVNELLPRLGILAYGTHSTRRLFGRLPDGELLEREMFLSMTKSLEDGTAGADRQIRDTREVLSIPGAIGVLVLLNESAPTLRPDLVAFGLGNLFGKRVANGSFRYPNVDGVVLISETHTLHGPQGRGAPCYAWPTMHARSIDDFLKFTYAMTKDWASFNNLPFLDISQHGLG